MMDLGLSGTTVESQTVDYTVSLQLSGGYFVRIESPFTFTGTGDCAGTALDPESDDPTAFEPLKGLLGLQVTEAIADPTGRLSISFNDGQSLVVEPDPNFEAWTVAGPEGYLVVCLAGGELTVWTRTSGE